LAGLGDGGCACRVFQHEVGAFDGSLGQEPGAGLARITAEDIFEEILDAIADMPNARESDTIKLRSEITKRFSFSFASLAFAFIAVPLGLVTRRRETSGGLVLSLMIAALYFVITTLAEHFDTAIGANLVMWSPNVICVVLGLYLFRRARFK
jgi:lipopolysaccharide export LptBFGC system permease protein LptF